MKVRAVENCEVLPAAAELPALFLNHSHDISAFEIPAAQGQDRHRPAGKRLAFFCGALLARGTQWSTPVIETPGGTACGEDGRVAVDESKCALQDRRQ